MPTATFYNLPEEKKRKLIAAVRKEFSRVPFPEVSINKIVISAGIPRGSYYQYFTDKQDLLDFVLEDYRRAMLEEIKKSFSERDGDIFLVFADMMKNSLLFAKDPQNIEICKNIFCYVRINDEPFFSGMKENLRNNIIEAHTVYVDRKALNAEDEEDVADILEILSANFIWSIAQLFRFTHDGEKIYKRYLNKLEILKRGMIKNSDNREGDLIQCQNSV